MVFYIRKNILYWLIYIYMYIYIIKLKRKTVTTKHVIKLPIVFPKRVGRDSSVGIATDYGLDGPGIESRWGRNFSHMSRPALGPTQPPIQWVPGLSRG
jgi:hypothetical protein